MKVWVWACRIMYVLLGAAAIGFYVLKDTEPIWALASAAAGIFIIMPLAISCAVMNNQRRRLRVPRTNPKVAEESEDIPQKLVGVWRWMPEELADEPKWRFDQQLDHVVEGVSAF